MDKLENRENKHTIVIIPSGRKTRGSDKAFDCVLYILIK